jgi:hypothetical protein
MTMTDDEFATLVKAAGLEATAARFPGDVRAALAMLARHKNQLPRTGDPTLEPTPAFRVESPKA